MFNVNYLNMIKESEKRKIWFLLGLMLFCLIVSIWVFEKGELLGVTLAK